MAVTTSAVGGDEHVERDEAVALGDEHGEQLAVGRQLDRARRLGAHRQIHRLEQRRRARVARRDAW